MRKFLILPTLVYPYLIALTLCGLFTDKIPGGNIYVILLILAVVWLIGLLMAAGYSLLGIVHGDDTLKDAWVLMILKLVQIPAYLFIFIAGLMCMITVFTIMISLILIAFDMMSVMLSGIAGISAAVGAARRFGTASAAIHALLGFIFCADVISAVVLYKKLKKAESMSLN